MGHEPWILVAAFGIGGVFGKLADDVADRELRLRSVWGILFNVIACGVLAVIARSDGCAAALVCGIFVAVVVSGKLDSMVHVFGAMTFMIVLGWSAWTSIWWEYRLVFAVIATSSLIDEILHERFDGRRKRLEAFLRGRWALVLATLALVFLGRLELHYGLAVWTFDAAYRAGEKITPLLARGAELVTEARER